eukprot:8494937-Pyramimonas_sp.AAC.1
MNAPGTSPWPRPRATTARLASTAHVPSMPRDAIARATACEHGARRPAPLRARGRSAAPEQSAP